MQFITTRPSTQPVTRFVAIALTLAAVLLLLGVAVKPGVASVSAGPALAPAVDPVLRVDPAVMEVGVGDKFWVDVMVDNANNMGAGEFTMLFDSMKLIANSSADGGFLASTGRTMPSAVGAPGPLGTPTTGQVPFGHYSIGNSPNGPNGTGRFAAIQMMANAAGTSNLTLQDQMVTDISGNAQTTTVANGSVTIDTAKVQFFPWNDNLNMQTWVLVGNPSTSQTANVDVYIGGSLVASNQPIAPGASWTPMFAGMGGPVKVVSTNGAQIFSSERTLYRGSSQQDSFNEVMSSPRNELTTEYWFPWNDNLNMQTWVLVGNPSASQTANVDVYIGGSLVASNQPIAPGASWTPQFAGMGGPVRVVSTNGVPVFSSERALYGNSFNEVMGIPRYQLGTEFWFPWNDNLNMQTWLLVGNPNTSLTAYVDVFIGGSQVANDQAIGPGASWTPQFAGMGGPVRVVSVANPSAGVPSSLPIFTSERALYAGSFNEVVGIPPSGFTTEFWFPWNDNLNMQTWVLVGNPSTSQTANVDVYIGGSLVASNQPIAPGASWTPQFAGMGGPVRVVSTNGVPVFSTERALYGPSFNEVIGVSFQ